jgi:hypothetical protein
MLNEGGGTSKTLSELPTGTPLKFEVRAKECFGRLSAPIRSEAITITT